MKKPSNTKTIVTILSASTIVAASLIFGVNTNQLTGFTQINRFNKVSTQASLPQNNQSSTPTRFEAIDSDLNKSKVKCNGVWQRGLEFVINYKQSQESLQFIHDKLHEFNTQGCQIAFQYRGIMSNRRTTIPYENEFTTTHYCNGELRTTPQMMECLTTNLSTQNGVSMMGFHKKFNSELQVMDEIKLIQTTNYTSDDFRHEQQVTEINQQRSPFIINILVK